MNRFNQWQSQLQTQAASDAAATRNAGNIRNVSEAQRVAEQNATNQYGVQQANLDRQNQLKQALAGFQLQKAQGTAGALGNLSQAKYAEQAAKMAAAKSIGKGVGSIGGGVMDMFGGGII